MRVGIPTEIKVQEFRVGITPAGVHALKEAGHTVLVQKGAGLGSMITDEEYVAAGAQMVATAKECWDCDMVVKVKEPLAPEYDLFHEGLILYTYLHLAPEPALTKALLEKRSSASLTKPCSSTTASCPCSLPCLKSPAAWPPRWALRC